MAPPEEKDSNPNPSAPMQPPPLPSFLPTSSPQNSSLPSLITLHSSNRRKLCRALLSKDVPSGSIVYLEGGPSTTRFDTDHEPIFRQESYFHYLFGVKEPDFSGCIKLKEEKCETVLFAARLPPDYATFMGRIPTLEEMKEEYSVDKVLYSDQIEEELQNSLQNSNSGKLLVLNGQNSDSEKYYPIPAIPSALERYMDSDTLFPILAECRVTKTPEELSLMRYITEITSQAHVYTMKHAPSLQFEYQLESLFRHYCYFLFGCRNVGYTPICACGPNASVLHYGHAGRPNDGRLKGGDLALLDMGAEYRCYGSDVTCTFPLTGTFTPCQKAVYEGVLQAQLDVMNVLQPGVSYLHCHLVAEQAILQALIQLDIIHLPQNTTLKYLVEEKRLGAVFMPHGLGHFIGIDTHDVGGYLDGHPPRSTLPGLRSLRTARILKPNMVLTVEPGCYFIHHLLEEAFANPELSPYLNEEKIRDQFWDFGGVRLEDVVCVTETGCENWTRCPRTVEEVEGVMAKGGKWPPVIDLAKGLKRTRLTATD